MATHVLLPQWGMNMEDGLLVKWLVEEGDTVEAGQPLVEVETAKINSELEAPVSGVVAYITAAEGSTVNVGALVAVIAEPGEVVERPVEGPPSPAAATRPAQTATPTQSATPGRAPSVQVTPVARRLARENDVDLERVRGSGPNGRIVESDVRRAIESGVAASRGTAVQVVPRARQLAKQHGIDLSQVTGSGPNGRVLVADVERLIGFPPGEDVAEVVRLSGLRKTIADRMAESVHTMAQVTLTTEADVTELVRLREALLPVWRPHRVRPMDQDLIVKATAAALMEFPRLNATLVNDEVRIMKDVNVGVAMAVPDGLMVPVVRSADEKDLLAVAQEVRTLAERSRGGALSLDEVTGASFTITSLSSFDIDAFTPIIDPPQVAILGVGRIVEKPAVRDGQIAVRSMMHLSLSFDHRAVDGVPAGEFLRGLKARLETPGWMAPEAEREGP